MPQIRMRTGDLAPQTSTTAVPPPTVCPLSPGSTSPSMIANLRSVLPTPAVTPDDVNASNSANDYDGAGTNVGIDAAKIVFSETTVFSVASDGTISAQWENTGQTVVAVYPIKRSIFLDWVGDLTAFAAYWPQPFTSVVLRLVATA